MHIVIVYSIRSETITVEMLDGEGKVNIRTDQVRTIIETVFMTLNDIITIINYQNFKDQYHYRYQYFQNTDSRTLVDLQPKIIKQAGS